MLPESAHQKLNPLRFNLTRRMSGNFGGLFIGNCGSLALAFFTTAYLARTLGQSEFGEFSYAQTLAIYAALFVDLGFTIYGNRAVAKYPERAARYLVNIVSLQAVTGVVLISICSIIIYNLDIWRDSNLKIIVITSLLWVLPFSLNFEWFFLGFEKMGVVGSSRTIQQGAISILTYMVVDNPQQVILAALMRVIGGFASAVWLLFQLPKCIFKGISPNLLEGANYLKESKWFWFSAFLVQVYNGTDILVLQMFWPPNEVGLYSASFRLIGVFVAVISLMNTAIFPILAGEHSKNPVLFGRTLRLHLIAAAGLSVLILVIGLPSKSLLVRVVYGSEYLSAVPFLGVLIIAASVLALNGAVAQPLLASGYEASVLKQTAVTAIMNASLNLVLIPYFGAYGASLAYMISVIIGTICLLPAYLRRMGHYLNLSHSMGE